MALLKNSIVRIQQEAGKGRIVLVSGNFNIIHPGHLRLLNFARTCGDYLVVALFSDSEPGVVLPVDLRRESLEALEAVSAVIELTNADYETVIHQLRPHAVVKGKEHERDANPEREILRGFGGHLIFSSGEAKFSSLDLIRKELLSPAEFAVQHDLGFLETHHSSLSTLAKIIDRFSGLRALVIGDLIIDEYIYCDPLGMSQEDPTIVVTPVDSRRFTGGAGIVAGHVAGLGAHSSFVSIVGADTTADEAMSSLREFRVDSTLVRDASRPTILKQRYRASNKTLLRVSHLRGHDAGEEFVAQVLEIVRGQMEATDVVIFSDFNYGCLPQSLVDAVADLCRQAGVPYVADSQASSQVGDVSRFKGAALISATEREARLAVNDFKSGLQHVANQLFEKAAPQMLMVKLGAEGLLVLGADQQFGTGSLAAMNPNPVDVAGAGDALLSAASLALAVGATPWECAYLGSIAASIQVSRIGNVPLSQQSLLRSLRP